MSQQGWASPGPAAMAALGVAAIGFGFSFLGKVPLEGVPLLAGWLVAAFIVQLLTAIVELKEGHMTGGNVMLFFSAFFMLATGIGMYVKYLMIGKGVIPYTVVEGYLWMSGALFLTLLTPAYARGSSALMFIMVCLVDVVLWMIVGMDTKWLGNPAILKPIAGYLLILVGLCGNYLGAAAIVNGAFGKVLLPVPGPVVKG